MSGNDDRLKYPIKSTTYSLSFTSKSVLKIFSLCRYCGGIGLSVDTKVLKPKIIPKNDVPLPRQYKGVLEGVLGKVLERVLGIVLGTVLEGYEKPPIKKSMCGMGNQTEMTIRIP